MHAKQSTSGVDLLVPDGAGGPRSRIERAVRVAIGDGRLQPGARLPSTRALARDLGVARSTVVDAYAQLSAEGWITGARGSGTRVASGVPHPPPTPATTAAAPTARYDLRPGRPDMSSFPRTAWIGALRRALRDEPDATFDYGDHRGHLGLRREIAAYVGRVRGVRTHPDHIVVSRGFGEALAVATTALRSTGASGMGVEDPCLARHHAIAAASGMRLHPLPVDDDGAAVVGLADAGADAVLLTPAHQQPLGVTLSGTRRGWLVEWARATGGTVIEDDYDSEFRYDRSPVGSLQGIAPDAVVHVGTVSKTLAPALRLGWLAVPPRLLDAVVAAKAAAGGQQPILDQLAFAEMLRSGAYDRHVRRMRLRYRTRRDLVLRRLTTEVPTASTSGIAAGLQVLVHLQPGGPSAADVVAAAAARGLAITAFGEDHWHRAESLAQTLVLGYGAPAEHAFHATLDVLLASLADVGLAKSRSRRS